MAPERRLIPLEDNLPTANTTRIICTANVVGVIPPKIHDILTITPPPQQSAPNQNNKLVGQIDNNSSGISFLINSNNNNNTISVWEHSTQTLNEDLIPPDRGICLKLSHPEHINNDVDGGNSRLLVTCLGPNNSSTVGGVVGIRDVGNQGRNASLRHLYAASPTTGVLCVWVLDYTKNNAQVNVNVDCDASVRLKLKDGEVLTSLTPISGGGDGGGSDAWLLVSTSLGRLWKIYKTSRPLTLHAKLCKRKMIADTSSNNSGVDEEEEEEEEETGIVRGLYNYFTTPSKATSRHDSNNDDVMDMGDNAENEDDEHIVAVISVPPSSYSNTMGELESSGKSPPRTPGISPQKQRRISAPSVDSSAHAISVSSSLVMKEWKVSLLAGGESSDTTSVVKEGCTSRTQLFPRNTNGILDLSCLNKSSQMEDDDSLDGYVNVEMLATPALAKDGKSVLMVIRIARENDNDTNRAYVVRIGGLLEKGGSTPHIIDAVWLDRYSSQQIGGMVECAGLVVAEDEVESNSTSGCVGGSVVYAAFSPAGDQVCPVTITSVHFPSYVRGQQQQQQPPRAKDLDLDSNVIPSAVQGSISYDSLTGGCCLLSTSGLLAGANVRFPVSSESSTREASSGSSLLDDVSLALLAQDETVLTVKSHLQSSFRQYITKVKEGSSGSNPARAVCPPSIGTCPSHILSAAVVLASHDFACASSSVGGVGFSPRVTTSSPVTILRDKLQMHQDFLTFLLHAGAYRRVSTAGRVRLRDNGEMITASRALLIECQNYFAKAESAGNVSSEQLAHARQMVMSALEGASNDITGLPHRWAALQQLQSDNLLLLTSSAICQGIGQALGYRQDESNSLYDIPSHNEDNIALPWTSSQETLGVLITQLRAIEQLGESILATSINYDDDVANIQSYVEDMSASVLCGYRDIVSTNPDKDALLVLYDDAKRLVVPLLRRYANDDGDDLVALQASLDHSFFEGIVQICHDHRSSWAFQGPFSDEQADETYDLRPMMSSNESQAHLHESRDYKTGLAFCSYVLQWFVDRGFYPEVFELGKNCPHDLTRYVRNDGRLSNLAWIQDLRTGGHSQATVGLLSSVTSPVLFGDKEGRISLWEKDQMLSLAKLSNKLASAKNPAAVEENRDTLIENNLTLISAQKMLQQDTEQGDEVALNEEDLIRLSVEKIQASGDVEDIKKFGICGLAISSAKPSSQADAMANDAANIWQAVIQSDMQLWEAVANENSKSVGGIAEEELIHRVEGTSFVGVLYDFIMSEGKQNVGFSAVKNQVSHAFGSDALTEVLAISADIVAAAN